MNKLLDQYLEEFGIYPPKLKMTSYDDDIYQQLLKDALEEHYPITNEDIERAYSGLKIDRAG